LGHFFNHSVFPEKEKTEKNLILQNSYEISAQRNKKQPKTARAKSQNAAKAWAVKLIARLGHIRPKTL
jgi:hypothetical protein